MIYIKMLAFCLSWVIFCSSGEKKTLYEKTSVKSMKETVQFMFGITAQLWKLRIYKELKMKNTKSLSAHSAVLL